MQKRKRIWNYCDGANRFGCNKLILTCYLNCYRYGEYSFCICRRQGYYIATQLAGVQFGVNSFGFFFLTFLWFSLLPAPYNTKFMREGLGWWTQFAAGSISMITSNSNQVMMIRFDWKLPEMVIWSDAARYLRLVNSFWADNRERPERSQLNY